MSTRENVRPLRVVVLGSAPLLVQHGLKESQAGRFEVLHLPHWAFGEMREAFGWSLDQFVYYGGYPGAAPLIRQPERWSRYIRHSLIQDDDLAGCASAHARGQACAAAAAVRAGVRVFGAGAVVQQDARSAAGRGQYDDAGALPGAAGRRGHADRVAEVLARRGRVAGLEEFLSKPVEHCVKR